MANNDSKLIKSFGEEWGKFNFLAFDKALLLPSFQRYFKLFPWGRLECDSEGFDMGCGTGRWAFFVAPKVGKLHCIDPSEALEVAKDQLREFQNIEFHSGTTEFSGLAPASQDFGYSLGVLHHIPDTLKALQDCSDLLKPGAPFLLYLYYKFDNRPLWYRLIWAVSELARKVISRLPAKIKMFTTDCIAITCYLPLSRIARLIESLGLDVDNFPLASYRFKTLYQCKTDALDRFGTRLENRFSKSDIHQMLIDTGFKQIAFSDEAPFWCCIAIKS